jgi:hypothetical protein
MKLNKAIKIIVIMLLVAMFTIAFSQIVSAIDPSTASLSNTFTKQDNSGASTAAANIIGMIINIAQVIGMGVAIIMLIVLAIKYIAAAPEGKAEIKKNATIYIVGAIILFAASGILGIVRNFAVQSVGNQGIDSGNTN